MSALDLSSEQLERLADLIADRLAARAAGELIDASELARRLGRSRDFVYAHGERLGAVRLGDGDRPRLAFRWPQVLDKLDGTERQRQPAPVAPRRRRREQLPQTAPLLPIKSGAAR
ncbi:hypothetical protein [Conexibacter sp. S30A1]|uniref:hypothetical protein n=1 Tax=Conexibacter sp. S30A1 TaxID=2937800 RepID=UPI00200D0DD0|nr:hypothetical protein [Conexibacter sp. S30A1]